MYALPLFDERQLGHDPPPVPQLRQPWALQLAGEQPISGLHELQPQLPVRVVWNRTGDGDCG